MLSELVFKLRMGVINAQIAQMEQMVLELIRNPESTSEQLGTGVAMLRNIYLNRRIVRAAAQHKLGVRA